MFSVIRLIGAVNFFIVKFLQVLYFPSTAAIKTENPEEEFLGSFHSNLRFQLLKIIPQFLFRSRVGNETWLKKSTEVSSYGKFIYDIFGWKTVKIGIIRAKYQFSV